MIEATDGETITVAQFVREVHDYVAGLRDLLNEATFGEREQGDVQYYFRGSIGPRRTAVKEQNVIISVCLKDSKSKDLDARWEKVIGWHQLRSRGGQN